jgi:5'-phosphate synthase pdxT subunit
MFVLDGTPLDRRYPYLKA